MAQESVRELKHPRREVQIHTIPKRHDALLKATRLHTVAFSTLMLSATAVCDLYKKSLTFRLFLVKLSHISLCASFTYHITAFLAG